MKTLYDRTMLAGMELKNRFVRSATWENLADEEGNLTPQLIRLYEELAAGGTGLIISSAAYLHPEDRGRN